MHKGTRRPTVFSIWNDLFHEAVPDEFIISALNIMEECAEPPAWGNKVYRFQFDEQGHFLPHRFLVLTKRPERMASVVDAWVRSLLKEGIGAHLGDIWFGLTVCNQAEADSKIPIFLNVPGKKFLSIEPMLGAIDLIKVFRRWGNSGYGCSDIGQTFFKDYIDAVILGGETGPGARPLHPDWVRSVRDQCSAAGVPFFFKSWGAHGLNWLNDDNGKIEGSEWMDRGIKKPGRELDGRVHDDLPWVTE